MTGQGRAGALADALGDALAAADLAYSDPVRARQLAGATLATAGSDGVGDAEVVSAALRALGMAAAASGDYAEAGTRLRQAAERAEAAGLTVRAGQARGSLAYVLLLTSGAKAALRELDRADAGLREGSTAARLQMQRGLVLSEVRRFPDAAASLERALDTLARAGGDDLLEADVRNNLAIVGLGVHDWGAARAQLRRAEALYASGGHVGRTAMVEHNRGILEAMCGDLPAALAAFDRAADRYRAAGLHPGLLPVDRAEALLGAGLVGEAREAAEQAVTEFARQRNAVDLVQARLLLAEAALLDGDAGTALAEADRARRSARRQERPRWAALAAHLRLAARWRSGELSDPGLSGAAATAGLRSATRTAAELSAAGWVVPALDARLVAARTATALGRSELARRHLASIGAARRTGPAELRMRAWHAEAMLRRSRGDRRGAARAVRAGLDVLDSVQATLGATDLRAYAFAPAAGLAAVGLELALESGRVDPVLRAAERSRAGVLHYRSARPPDDAELADELAQLRQVVTELRSGDAGDPPGSAGSAGSAGLPALAALAALAARQSALERSIRDRARHASGGAAGRAARPSTAALRTVLGGERTDGPRTLVEYVELHGMLHAVVIRPDGPAAVRRLGPVADVAAALDALRAGLHWLAVGVGSPRAAAAVHAVVERRAKELDDALFGPLQLGAGDAALVLVPTGALHALPWSALPSCARRAVSVAPSAALWHRAATDARPGDGATVLACGPGLPHGAAEVQALARRYPAATALTGPDAGVAAVLAALDGSGLAHLAAHGHFRADNPMFSALRFADGPLTVYDLERLTVPPRQVVLASCDSGLARVRTGDGLIGLAAALLSMGSTTLVAAVVPVPDEAGRVIMEDFHRHLAAGCGAAAALREARTQSTDAADGAAAAEVAAAGFVCFGAG